MFYNINNFLIYSIFGFFFETILFNILDLHYHSGFMYLWWTPFYGNGVIIINYINNIISKKIKNKSIKNIVLFFILFIALTLLELLGGFILELIHGYSLWNYYMVPLHIGKYISIPTSLLWVIFAFIYIYIIKKYSDKFLNKIPKWVTIVGSLLFVSDFVFTLVRLFLNRM